MYPCTVWEAGSEFGAGVRRWSSWEPRAARSAHTTPCQSLPPGVKEDDALHFAPAAQAPGDSQRQPNQQPRLRHREGDRLRDGGEGVDAQGSGHARGRGPDDLGAEGEQQSQTVPLIFFVVPPLLFASASLSAGRRCVRERSAARDSAGVQSCSRLLAGPALASRLTRAGRNLFLRDGTSPSSSPTAHRRSQRMA